MKVKYKLNLTLVNKYVFIIILAGAIYFNGIGNYFFGEFISEGVALIITIVFLYTREISKFRISMFHFVIISLLIINLTQILLVGTWARLLFFYPYLILIIILSLSIYSDNSDTTLKICVYFACVSSIYAVTQRLGFDTFLTLENPIRATGLSRSSLNLTGCLFSILAACVLVAKDNFFKLFYVSLIFTGIVAAGGRGGMISAIILLIFYYIKHVSLVKVIITALVTMLLTFSLLGVESVLRAFTAFDFVNDRSNIQRFDSYLLFFDEFYFFGGGIGSTSPAALRFMEATGFESSFLNLIYELGVIFSILFLIFSLLWYLKLLPVTRKKMFIYMFSIAPLILGQQLYGIPSAFAALAISFYIILSNKRPVSL
jgi:hypothetical protein